MIIQLGTRISGGHTSAMSDCPAMARSLADSDCEDDQLAAPEWTLPARHVAGLALAAFAFCLVLALLG